MKAKPIAERLSQWNNANEVIYSCPNCRCSFNIYGSKEKFCHNCGQEIDWNVILYANEYIKGQYHNSNSYDEKKAVISLINLLNAQSNFVSSVELTQFSKSVENRFASILNHIVRRGNISALDFIHLNDTVI